MKLVKMTITALALATLSFSVMAATLVDVKPVDQQKIGVISACSSSNSLTSLQRELENKAKEAGASAYRIIGASGNNRLCGTAEIYH
jgi:multiple stress resistance protein BhsA